MTPSAGQSLVPQPLPDDAEQQAALLLACSGDTLPASLPPVNMYDLFEALQVSCLSYAAVSPGSAVPSSRYQYQFWFLCMEGGLSSPTISLLRSLSYLPFIGFDLLTCSQLAV